MSGEQIISKADSLWGGAAPTALHAANSNSLSPSSTSKRVDVSVRTRQEAEAAGLLPEQTRSLHWWVRPKARMADRVEELASMLALPTRSDVDCLGRLLAELVSLPGVWLSYSRTPDWYALWTGYLPASVGRRSVVRVVDALRDAGLVAHCLGYKAKDGDGFQSKLKALPELLDMFPAKVAAETEADPNAPLVIVKDEKGNPCAPADMALFDMHCRKVKALREWMRTFVIEAPAQPGRKELTQMFSSAEMDQHGRYYGWWQNLRKAERLCIKLNGSPVCELDYGQNHPSILYNGLGRDVPENAYTVEGEERELCKATFGRMLNGSSESGLVWKLGQELGSRERAQRLVSSLLEIHRPLADANKLWHSIGNELMRKDAEVAVLVMTWAMWRKLPMLPVHDSFVVGREHQAEVLKQMRQSYHAHMGVWPEVKVTGHQFSQWA